MRILLIDDEAPLRMLMRQMLEGAGHQVVEGENGRVGLAAFASAPTDVVVTDIIMPEAEGIETMLEIRKLAPAVRIVAISGGGRMKADFLGMARQLGAQATLPKPFRKEEFLDCVEGRSAGRSVT
jgi:CheY-like chemotaxis protein